MTQPAAIESPLGRLGGRLSGPGLGATLARGAAGGGGVRLVGMALSFLVGLQLARGLGPAGYGVYAAAMSVVALLSIPSEFGVPQVVTRELAAGREREDWAAGAGVLRWADRGVLALSGLTAALAAAWVWAFGGEGPLAATLAWAVVLVPVVGLAKVRASALRGLMRVVLGQVPDLIVRPAAMSVLLAAAAAAGVALTAPRAMAAGVLAAGAALAFGAVALRRATPAEVRAAAPRSEGRAWMAAAAPMGLTDGIRILQGHASILILTAAAAPEAVGVYQVAARVATLAAMPIALLNIVAAPLLAKLHAAGDRAGTRRALWGSAAAMAGGVGLLSLPLVLFGGPILGLVFGEEYAGGAGPLAVLCGANLVSAACGPNAALLNMTGHERRVTAAFLWSLPASLLSAAALVPALGASGAAMSVVCGTLAWNAALWRSARRHAGLDPTVLGGLWPAKPTSSEEDR